MRAVRALPRLILACLAAGAFAASCGDDGDTGGATRREAGGLLELRYPGGAAPPPDRVVRRVEVPRAYESAWSVRAPERELALWTAADGSERVGLHLAGGGEHVITIPGAYDARTFDAVAVHVATTTRFRASAELRSRNARGAVKVTKPVWDRGAKSTRILFDVRAAAGRTFDELVLRVTGEPTDWTLLAVELLERPAERWLPLAGDEWGLIRIGRDARRGVGLSNRAPLVAETSVPEGGRLGFSYGWPEHGGGGAEVIVRVSGQTGVERAFVRPLPARDESAPIWNEASIDLAEWAGRRVTVEFELAAAGTAPPVCALAEARVVAPDSLAPLVLLITSDTHRADHLGVAERAVDIRTPTLDALAAEGILYEDCFSSSNVTIPSHVALMTGVHPRDSGIVHNEKSLAEGAETLAEHFRAAGFATFAAVSVFHLAPEVAGLAQGFDRYSWPRGRESSAAVAIERLASWIESAEGRPVFAWLHVFDAHTPYAPPAPYDELYYPADKDAFDTSLPRRNFPVPAQEGVGRLRDLQWLVAQYRGEVTYLDAQLARLLELPRVARGIVAMTADHGESLSQHGIFWRHFGLYPDTIHVPLVLKVPGGPRGVRISRGVRQMDLGLTLLELAGVEARFPGRSLLETAPGSAAETPRFALGTRCKEASIRAGRWFLNLNLIAYSRNRDTEDWGVFERHQVELYDLETDPACDRNLAGMEHERARELRARLVRWLCSAVDTGLSAEGLDSEEARSALAQLGYATGEPEVSTLDLIDPECDCANCAPFR